VIGRVRAVAYRLQLPKNTKIHPVFHVSLLEKHVGATPNMLGVVPDVDELGLLATKPIVVLARKLGKNGNKVVVYLLIQWVNKPKEDATWELYSDIEANFPEFNLEA